jgi:hypothetical protein
VRLLSGFARCIRSIAGLSISARNRSRECRQRAERGHRRLRRTLACPSIGKTYVFEHPNIRPVDG